MGGEVICSVAVFPPIAGEIASLSGLVPLAFSIQTVSSLGVSFSFYWSVLYLCIGASIIPLLLHEICFPLP